VIPTRFTTSVGTPSPVHKDSQLLVLSTSTSGMPASLVVPRPRVFSAAMSRLLSLALLLMTKDSASPVVLTPKFTSGVVMMDAPAKVP